MVVLDGASARDLAMLRVEQQIAYSLAALMRAEKLPKFEKVFPDPARRRRSARQQTSEEMLQAMLGWSDQVNGMKRK